MKGQTDTQELTGLDLFVGRNGVGKTTRLQALGIAMLGYVPGQGKTAADTFKLSTNGSMTAGLKTDNFYFTRTFTRKETNDRKSGIPKVTVSESITVSPGMGEKTETEKKARIMTEIGHFPVMMDFGEFLSLSDAKRRDFIYSLRHDDSEDWTRDKVQEYLVERLLTAELQENNIEQYQVMAELIDQVMNEFPVNFGVQDGLRSMIDWVTAQRSYWDGKKKDALGAVRQISEKKNELAETDRNIREHKQELDGLHQQLIDIEKQITASQEKKRNNDRRVARVNELKSLITALEGSPANDDMSDLDRQINQLQSQIEEPPNTNDQMSALDIKIDHLRNDREVLEDKVRGVKDQISSIKTTISSLEQALTSTGELSGRCIIHQMISCPKNFSGFSSWVTSKKEEAGKAIASLQVQLNELRQQVDDINKRIRDSQFEQSSVMQKAQAVIDKNRSLQNKINSIEREINDRIAAGQRRIDLLNLYRDELNRLRNEPTEEIKPTDELESHAATIRTRIDELKKSITDKEKAKQTILLLKQSMVENRRAEYSSVCLKSIAEALGPKGIQGELVKEMLDPILGDIQGNLKLMGFHHAPFFETESENGKEIFQFGWINEKGHRVNFDALSTGQQTVFLAAMMMVILDRARPKLKILAMDNLNHLDRHNFQLMINGLSKLKGKLDNIILAGAIEFSFEAAGWKVWQLGEAAAA